MNITGSIGSFPPYVSQTSSVELILVTEGNVTYRGFSITYQSRLNDACFSLMDEPKT